MGWESDYIEKAFGRLPDEDPLWRFMDLPKFLHLLSHSALWFTRADLLGDPFEGSFPVKMANSRLEDMLQDDSVPENIRDNLENWGAELYEYMRKQAWVCCWHRNLHESAALWHRYAGTGAGVAIRTSVGRLRDAIHSSAPVSIGPVEYVDFDTYYAPVKLHFALLGRYFLKRKSFEYEQEARAIMILGASEDESEEWSKAIESLYGLPVKVDLERLVDGIFVAPTSPDWVKRLIGELVSKLSGVNTLPIYKSVLDKDPIF